jgi:hypothetical protein
MNHVIKRSSSPCYKRTGVDRLATPTQRPFLTTESLVWCSILLTPEPWRPQRPRCFSVLSQMNSITLCHKGQFECCVILHVMWFSVQQRRWLKIDNVTEVAASIFRIISYGPVAGPWTQMHLVPVRVYTCTYVYIRIQCSLTHILCMNCILRMHKLKKSLCRDRRIATSNYIMRKTLCIHSHFLILGVPHQDGSPVATRGFERTDHHVCRWYFVSS